MYSQLLFVFLHLLSLQLLAMLLIQYERLHGVQSSGVLTIFWFVCLLCAVGTLWSKIVPSPTQVISGICICGCKTKRCARVDGGEQEKIGLSYSCLQHRIWMKHGMMLNENLGKVMWSSPFHRKKQRSFVGFDFFLT